MPRILVMSDSTCDVPPAWVERYDLRIVPTYVQFDTESLADDGVQLTRRDFYERLVTSPVQPTTAAPPPGQTLSIMQQALADADHVIGITAPAKLSGIYNTFRLAAEQTDPQRVTLIDSTGLSMGMGWQVIIAAEMAQAGADPDTIRRAVLDVQPRADVWAALDTLEYVRRSGRVSWTAALVGNFLQIKTIIRMYDSEVTSVARVRTSYRSFEMLVQLAHDAAPLERLAVMHTANPEGARQLEAALEDIYPDHERLIVEATPVLGVHVGPNALGLGVVRKHTIGQ